MMDESAIFHALKKHYCQEHGNGQRYAILPAVRNYCGFCKGKRNGHREADAVLLSLWRSDGLKITGFEVKVSRSDYKQELRDPEKWKGVGKYCDAWYIAAPDGLLDPDDVSPPWGLITVDAEGKVHKRKFASVLSPVPLDREFIVQIFKGWAWQCEIQEHHGGGATP